MIDCLFFNKKIFWILHAQGKQCFDEISINNNFAATQWSLVSYYHRIAVLVFARNTKKKKMEEREKEICFMRFKIIVRARRFSRLYRSAIVTLTCETSQCIHVKSVRNHQEQCTSLIEVQPRVITSVKNESTESYHIWTKISLIF